MAEAAVAFRQEQVAGRDWEGAFQAIVAGIETAPQYRLVDDMPDVAKERQAVRERAKAILAGRREVRDHGTAAEVAELPPQVE